MTPNTPPGGQSNLWRSTLGHRLAEHQATLLQPLLRRMLGDAVLWIGEENTMPNALAQCMVRLPVFVTNSSLAAPRAADAVQCIQASCDHLPFASNSLDGVVLHHTLETHADPRACIREVERVLKPGGRLLICSFNPFSLTGLRAWLARSRDNPLRGRRLISPIRLLDWLALLNLSLDQPPCYRVLPAPSVQKFWQRWSRRGHTSVGKVMVRPGIFLGQCWSKVAPLLMPLFRQLPVGGVVVLSAYKVRQGGKLIGRTVLTQTRKRGLVLTPTVQSRRDG